jgi:lysophospholipase L1-like esterase
VVFLAAGLVMAVLIGVPELIVRLLYKPASSSAILPPSGELLWEMPPGPTAKFGAATRINALGMRGPEVRMPRPSGVRRVLFVGDSTIYGVGIPDGRVFTDRIAAALGDRVDILNAGVPGYSSEQALRFLELRGMSTRPDLVVVATLWSDNNFDTFVDREQLSGSLQSGRSRRGAMLRLLSHSALFRFVEQSVAGRRAGGFPFLARGKVLGRRRVELNDYARNLEAIVTLARRSGAETAFLLLANIEDIRAPERAWPWDPYRQVMRDTARRSGSPLIDLPDAFRRSGQPLRALFIDAMHPTETGHRLMGEAVLDVLRSARWAGGGAVMTRGEAGPSPRWIDPWVTPWPGDAAIPAQQLEPLRRLRCTGLLRGSARPTHGLELELLDAGQATAPRVDGVELPGPAPFALDPGPASRVRLRAILRDGPPGGTSSVATLELDGAGVDVSRGPAWGLTVDMDTREVRTASGTDL